jgi:predicted esterase
MEGGAVRVTGFDFVLRLPENPPAGSWPLLVIVHGATQHPSIQGGRRAEIEEAARQMEFPFLTVAPIVNREMRGGGWNPGELAALVESIAASYPIDRDRVYLSGFSAGAAATVATVARRPDLFAAYAPLCGSGDPALASALAQVPAYLYHGDADPTNLCFASVRFHQALEAAGGQPSLRVYRRMGHQVWVEVYREVDFYRRLLAHRRVPLVGTPLAAIEPGGEGNRLEFHAATAASEMQVCWIDQSLKAGELWTEENSLRRLQQKLEMLYPTVPIAGNVVLHCPAGWSDASSPVFVGIAVQGTAPIPAGFVLRPLRPIGRLAATYRGEFQDAGLVEAVRRFQVLRTNEGDAPGRSLMIVLEHLGRRSGGSSRVLVRAAAE